MRRLRREILSRDRHRDACGQRRTHSYAGSPSWLAFVLRELRAASHDAEECLCCEHALERGDGSRGGTAGPACGAADSMNRRACSLAQRDSLGPGRQPLSQRSLERGSEDSTRGANRSGRARKRPVNPSCAGCWHGLRCVPATNRPAFVFPAHQAHPNGPSTRRQVHAEALVLPVPANTGLCRHAALETRQSIHCVSWKACVHNGRHAHDLQRL